MLRKGLAVVVILLFIGVAFTSSINAKDKETNDDTTEPLDIGRCIGRGFGIFPIYGEDSITFFALRFHLLSINGTEREMDTISFRWITIPNDYSGYYIVGLLNILLYFFGATFKGGIDF